MSAADINVAFLEAYKKADAFIRDAYGTKDGVTEYLRRMEVVRGGSLACATWDEDYRRLKQARWQRNQLSHDVSVETEFCAPEDLDWLERFYERLYATTDPLALYRKEEKRRQTERETRAAAARKAQREAAAKAEAEQKRAEQEALARRAEEERQAEAKRNAEHLTEAARQMAERKAESKPEKKSSIGCFIWFLLLVLIFICAYWIGMKLL